MRFWHGSARVEPKWRRGVVVRMADGRLDIVPGFSERPYHDDFLAVDNPSRRSGLDRVTYFDLRDINATAIAEVEVLGIFPHARFMELLERLAELEDPCVR